ncbi:CPBP family intramembrane metalloprotease [Clostridium sp. CS001]|uniref:CPBP family intramembrane glutamic endopeptidase n=1 Tax=Clostridium sp. CS001 TaxID=2880648 RepID=UPI001CF26AE2|nr:type II CAAX endopeptidase family protein [Clostridium sp. CS001]MCB2289249.1 CPBP family intramembrane metalloprotease [Clostridium sp. CS001]
MKVLRNIENGTTSIKKMGIVKTFLVLLLSVLLETLGLIPITILNLFSESFGKAAPYIDFSLGILVKYVVIVILLKWFSNKTGEQKTKHHFGPRRFIYTALIIIAFRMIFDNSLTLLISDITVPDFINDAFEELAVSPIILILSVAVVAPVYEEVIFRGILLKGMSKKINPAIALIISALFFALVHMNIPQGINAFLLGIVIGAIYLKTGSIYLSIFAHFTNNILAITMSSLFMTIAGKYSMVAHGIFLIIGVILLVISCKGYNQNKMEENPEIYKQFVEM